MSRRELERERRSFGRFGKERRGIGRWRGCVSCGGREMERKRER